MSDLISGYAARLRAADYSTRTIADRLRLLRRFDEQLPYGLAQANADELEDLLGQWTGWTLYTYFEHLVGFYAYAVRRRGLDFNPMDLLDRPRTPSREPNPVPDDQIAHALYKLRDPWRRGVLLATLNGLRCAEIVTLDRQHVSREQLYLRRKGGKTQSLPTHPDVWADLAGLPPGPVVQPAAGGRFTPLRYSARVSQELTAIGLPDAHLHRFRASYATRSARHGVHATVIQDLMGHASLTTTQRYIQVSDGQRRHAVETLPTPTANPVQEAA